MDDEVGHRFEPDHTVRNVICVAIITILTLAVVEYLHLSERTISILIGVASGSSVDFIVGYLVGKKR